jgi:hypothetical protein
MAHKVILPPKKNYIPQFLKQRDINSYYVCRTSDSTVSEDAEIEPRTVATTALAVKRYNHWAIDLIHN